MENQYGIGVTNRYALFLTDEDPLEKLKAKKKAKEAKKKKLQASSAEKENKGVKTNVPKDKVVKTNGIKDSQNLKPDIKPKEDAAKQPKKLDNGKFDEKKPAPIETPKDNETENNTVNRRENFSEDKEKRFNYNARGYGGDREPRESRNREDGERYGSGRGGSSGSRPPRGRGGRGRGGDFKGKREFDRQSGSDKTGIKPTTKRNGAGQHNWGNDRDDFDEQINNSGGNGGVSDTSADWGVDQSKANESTASIEVNGEKKDIPANETSENAEDQAKELTLDEWKAARGIKLLKPQYNLRKAGEGEDLTQWQNMFELKKKKEEKEAAEQLLEEEKANELLARAPKKKEIVDTNFHFADPPTRKGRNKGRGGMRGGREGGDRDKNLRDRGPREKREFSRGGSRNAPKVDVNNELDFPSLG